MKQADIFSISEGDAWFARNRDGLGSTDLVMETIKQCWIRPESALEIGCANGWRLGRLQSDYQCGAVGIEPSDAARIAARQRGLSVYPGTADALLLNSDSFDLVIFGFCLYLTDPADWFAIAAEADRVLQVGGYLIIHDFDAPAPHARKYAHCDGVHSYHFDFAKLWLASPLYTLIRRRITAEQSVTVLRKRSAAEAIEVLP